MARMDHAEAHERIADLALEPSRLAGLAASVAADDEALREHIDTCARCQAELREWHDFQSSLGDALADNRREQLEPISPPPDLRRRVLAAAHAEPKPAPVPENVIPMRRFALPISRSSLVALAAVFALVVGGLGVAFMRSQSVRLDATALEHRWLSDTVAAMNRVLVAPGHELVMLRTADGVASGSIAWSHHDLVVLAGVLADPGQGQVYRCWLSYEGNETAMGRMWFVDGSAFWVGSTQDWAQIDLNPEKQFLVTLESTSNLSNQHAGPVVLQATLGDS